MSQSELSQVIVEKEFEGLVIRFAYPSFDANVSLKSNKYNHNITTEQAQYIRDKLNEYLDKQEIHSKLASYALCHHCPHINKIKSVIKIYDSSISTVTTQDSDKLGIDKK